jgi:hypothetical protein
MRLVGASLKAIKAYGGLLGCRFDEENSGYNKKEQVSRSVFKRESPLTPFTSSSSTTLLLWWVCVLAKPWCCSVEYSEKQSIVYCSVVLLCSCCPLKGQQQGLFT